VLGEDANVLGALAKGGDAQGDNGEAIVEVLAEAALSDFGGEILVGSGDDADADADGEFAAEAVELAFLEDAEELGLGGLGQVAYFIEEEGTGIGEFELAAAEAGGAGKGSLLMAEEFAFHEFVGDGGAVDLDEGAGGEGRVGVDVSGEELLAGAGLTHEEDADIAFGGQSGLFDDALEGGGGAQHTGAADLLFEAFIFFPEDELVEGVADSEENAVAVERFFEEVVGAGVDGLDGVGDGAVSGDHDDGGGEIGGAEFAEEIKAGGVGKADIEEEEGDLFTALGAAAGGGGGEGGDGKAFAFEDEAEGEADIGLIVNDPDFSHERIPWQRAV
jgi:hypothetical protein